MDCFLFEQVRKMRPSSFSEEERDCYQAEKKLLRQFMLMKQQDQVPDHLSVKDMKTWLLTGRSFLAEFQEEFATLEIKLLFMNELVWTTARHFCLNQMEQELLEELDKERQLSQLFNRNVTLKGLDMFVSVVRPAAQEDVRALLPSLHSTQLKIFYGIQVSTGDAKPTELLELEQRTAPLVPKVVDTALKFLLEEPEWKDMSKAATAEVALLLTNSAAPCLCQFGSLSLPLLLGVCATAARSMVQAIYKIAVNWSKSFRLMDYDESFFSAREGVISAIQCMERRAQTAESTQTHLRLSSSEQLEQGLVEQREASPPVTATEGLQEQVATVQTAMTNGTSLARLETNVIVCMEDELEVLQREEVEESEPEKFLVQDCVVKKKGVRAFFRVLWRKMTCCIRVSTED